MSIPYEKATSGAAARDEATKLLRRLGCEKIGFMDDFAAGTVEVYFVHRGRPVRMVASGAGWAKMFLRVNPHTSRHRKSAAAYEADAQKQGLVAVNSIIRDWIKGSVTAIECGVMSVDAMFLPHMITGDGRTVMERVDEIGGLLPAPASK